MIHDVITNFIASLAGQYLFPLLVPGFLFRSFAYVYLFTKFCSTSGTDIEYLDDNCLMSKYSARSFNP